MPNLPACWRALSAPTPSPAPRPCATPIPSSGRTARHCTYQLVNLKDWCKNSFEVVNQLRINTKSSFQRYDVILLLNGLPLVQI
ncbi:type I restriction endonuclease, partial [Thiolapillus sp.]|uniref:type I restriction endonuclease n=1 Tax=Thiolapillus sp. TaxID=2017437 RepID=UPI003AF87508